MKTFLTSTQALNKLLNSFSCPSWPNLAYWPDLCCFQSLIRPGSRIAACSRQACPCSNIPSPLADHWKASFDSRCSGFQYNKTGKVCQTFVFGPGSYNFFYTNELQTNAIHIREDIYGWSVGLEGVGWHSRPRELNHCE